GRSGTGRVAPGHRGTAPVASGGRARGGHLLARGAVRGGPSGCGCGPVRPARRAGGIAGDRTGRGTAGARTRRHGGTPVRAAPFGGRAGPRSGRGRPYPDPSVPW